MAKSTVIAGQASGFSVQVTATDGLVNPYGGNPHHFLAILRVMMLPSGNTLTYR